MSPTSSRKVSRRSFLCTASTATLLGHRLQAKQAEKGTDPASIAVRRKAAWRRRPLILDDDGDLVYADESIRGPKEFLKLRMHDAHAASINSIAWCMMRGIAKKGKSTVRYWQTQKLGIPFQKNMPDPTPIVADFCRENNIEVFGSIRMNDCHDAFGLPFPKLVYPLKVNHPEMLFGKASQRGRPQDGLHAAMWSGLDYSFEKVRQDRLWWIENTARYGLDGVDLNFFRMPFYFKLGREEENMPVMTQFIRDARHRIDAVSRELGRTVLLGLRVPGTIAACQRIGFDIETWLREGLVDRLLTGGGYVCYSTPAEELVRLGHQFEVPVYPCINCPANYSIGGDNLRAAASNLWWAGADGIYLWNFQYIPAPGSLGYGRPAPGQYTQLLPEIADPQKLKHLNKSFAVNRRVWEQYGRAGAQAPLPTELGQRAGDGAPPIAVRIGDDIQSALKLGKLKNLTLRVTTSGAVSGGRLAATLNGSPAKPLPTNEKNKFAFALDGRAARQGINELNISIKQRGTRAKEAIVANAVNIDVRYH
ncbi:MAG: hypothetical protein MK538_05450 [Planctomycetes bacterium]|nr:hypothetical protein [Planctomycetota bacterium]